MSKWQQAKTLMTGVAYFLTGIFLIIGSLVMLGVIIDTLIASYGVTTMPELVRWTPLFFMLVAVGWGAFLIYKGIVKAGGLFFYLLGKATYKLLQLHRVPYKVACLLGVVIALAGFVIICVEVGPAFMADEVPQPTVALIGIVLILLGIATMGYTIAKHEQESATKA